MCIRDRSTEGQHSSGRFCLQYLAQVKQEIHIKSYREVKNYVQDINREPQLTNPWTVDNGKKYQLKLTMRIKKNIIALCSTLY